MLSGLFVLERIDADLDLLRRPNVGMIILDSKTPRHYDYLGFGECPP